MAVCEICGARIGLGNQAYLMIPGTHRYLDMCKNCEGRLEILKHPTKKTLEEARNYLKPCMERKEMRQDVREYLATSISEAYKKVDETQSQMKLQAEAKEAREQRVKEASFHKAENARNFKMTTGNTFEGYDITEYIDIVSGEVVLGTGFLSEIEARMRDVLGESAGLYEGKFDEAKKIALNCAVQNALDLGANALLAVDFDILTIANNMIVTCANGTAVRIKKREE